MINSVRNTVLSVINKDNNGYITVEEFNLYAKLAQLEIFEQYFYDLNSAVNKRNAHTYTSGHGDIPRRIEEQDINRFTVSAPLAFASTTMTYEIPSNCYSLGTVVLSNLTTIVDNINHDRIPYLNQSLDTSPSTDYPVYVVFGSEIRVFPDTITSAGQVVANYVRYPRTPRWTYTAVSGGDPLFNPSAPDYQDFELPMDDEKNLVAKILGYAGVEIREPEVVRVAKSEEIQEKQEQK